VAPSISMARRMSGLYPAGAGRHACQMEFNFFYDPKMREKMVIRELRRQATSAVMAKGAYVTRPYPVVADLVYQKYGEYAALLKRFKKHFDPNGILNPATLLLENRGEKQVSEKKLELGLNLMITNTTPATGRHRTWPLDRLQLRPGH